MNKRINLSALVLILLFGLCAFFPKVAYAAAETADLWVAPSDANGIPAQINVLKKGTADGGNSGGWNPWGGGGAWNPGGSSQSGTDEYQLFLPGDADLSACFFTWDGDALVTVDGVAYASGECPIPPVDTQKTYSYTDADGTLKEIKITTYQGSAAVQSVFIEIDESEGNNTIQQMNSDQDHETTCTGDICIEGKWYVLSKIKGRGNVTWKTNSSGKKPYNLTLDKKINWPGIDSDKTKKWSILAEPFDKSLLGNRVGFDIAYQMGIGQDTASADVWMNGEYLGCYTVTAKTDSFVTKNGYMLENDNYTEDSIENGGDPQFRLRGVNATNSTGQGPLITVKKIGDNLLLDENGNVDESAASLRAASAEIQAWMQDAWDAIRSTSGYNSKGKYYTEYIDIESFAKMYLMHEYIKSFDVRAGSILFYRDGTGEDDLLYAGPLWDLDNAMGSTSSNMALGSAVADRRSGEGNFISNLSNSGSSIYQSLGTHADFMWEVYRQFNHNKDAFANAPAVLDQLEADVAASALMNHAKVNVISNDNHTYSRDTTLGSGQYTQNYVANPSGSTVWETYVQNLHTYVSTRSLWFANNYTMSVSDGWFAYGGTYYYLEDYKPMESGWAEYAGRWYYIKNGTAMAEGWAEYEGIWYYFRNYNFLKEGWVAYGSGYVYFKDYTLLEEGWATYNGKYYYIQNYVPVLDTWIEWENSWYHFGKSGVCDYVYTPPAAEPEEEPVEEPVSEPVSESVSEPATEPVKETVVEPDSVDVADAA